MKNRWIALILAALLVLPLTGCAGEEEETGAVLTEPAAAAEEPGETEAPETDIVDALPAPDLGGLTYKMLGVSYPTRRNFAAEEETGEVVNDALAHRDMAASDRLNIVIAAQAEADAAGVTKIVQDSVSAGDEVCHVIISDIASSLMTLMTKGVLYDMRTMGGMELSENWWSPGMYENAAIGGRQYMTMGDISPMKYYAPYCLAYNLKVGTDYGYSDLYDEVLNGKWTLDLFDTMLKNANHDLDGDGDIDRDDFHGYAHVQTDITAWSHYTGAGQKLSSLDRDGNIVISIGDDLSVRVMEKVKAVLGYSPQFVPGNTDTTDMFMEDRALFFGNSYSGIIANFRDMESDFSVIPAPKWDEGQDRYYSFINTYCLGGVAVPGTCSDPENTGLITETLCRLSYLEVRPALYETTIKSKVSRFEENGKILDMIFDNTYIDANGLFNIGGSASVVVNTVYGRAEFASAYAAAQKKMQSDIEKLMKIGQP